MTKCLESVSDLDKGRKWHGCRQTDREEKVCARCVICVTRTWAERIHIMDIDDMWYLPNDTSTRFQHSSGAWFFVVDWRLTIDTVRLLNRMVFACVLPLRAFELCCMMCFDAVDTWNLLDEGKFPTVLKVSSEIFGIDSNLLRSVRLFPQGPPEIFGKEAVVSYKDL